MQVQNRLVPHTAVEETWPGIMLALIELDPRLAPLVGAAPPCRIERVANPFEALCMTIMYQQIAGATAQKIVAKVKTTYPGLLDSPANFLSLPPTALMGLGVPARRIDTMHRLAQAAETGDLDLAGFASWPDEDVRRALETIPGIGPWSSGMFCLFHLGRPDIFLPGDIGVRKGIARLLGREAVSPKEAVAASNAWRPYRSAAMWLLWHSVPGFPTPGVR